MSAKPNTADIIHLRENLQHREAEIELLQATFAEIGSELDLEKVFEIVATQARELIQAETLLIPILDEACETYTYRGGAGENSAEIVGESLPLDFGVCGWVWRHRRPWWRGMLNELTEDERNRWEKEAGTVILVPLQGRRHFLGGIAGINKIGGGDFDRRDLNLLSLFASIVAIAIENAMVVKKIEQAKRVTEDYQLQLERLNRQLSESNHELEYLSLYDTVTGLPNRSLFRDRLSQHISMAGISKQNIGLLLIDLNNFREINETLGHDTGDDLLKEIANRFSVNLGNNETLSRLGGDEFVLILPRHDSRKSLAFAKKFLKLLDKSFVISDHKIAVGASIGVTVYPDQGTDIGTLLSHADHAMYQAKKQKKGICLYNPGDDPSSLGQLTLSADLRKALAEKQFELHYQPKISLHDNKIHELEALGRWNHPTRGFIAPHIFINALEHMGIIDEYTYWAIETAYSQVTHWQAKNIDIKISVNLSTQTLMNNEFIIFLEKLIPNANQGDHLIFEITENLFLSEFERLSETLQRIRRLGITLSIDDFGTGYSSLSRLKRLPVSELKIDRSFIVDMTRDADDEVIVRSTIDLAHNLGLVVVAEGVEDQEAYQRLAELGCDMIQGFLISKALPIELLEQFLLKHSS